MNDPFRQFAGIAAMIVGVLSILYAIFFLLITAQAAVFGSVGAWLILAVSGIFSTAAYIGLYQRVRQTSEGYALYALVFGLVLGVVQLLEGAYQAIVIATAQGTPQTALTPVDPKGISFLAFAVASFIFGWLIVRGGALPRTLGYLGMVNALFLVVLFLSNVFGVMTLVLLSGGPTSLILTPIWYLWLGLQLMREPASQ